MNTTNVKLTNDIPKEVFSLYSQHRYLGIAVVDHNNFHGFQLLRRLIEEIGSDKNLKTITVEDSSIYAELYSRLSIENPENYLADLKIIPKTKQFLEIYNNIMPAVRLINKQRKNDPLLVVPIDSMNDTTETMPMYYVGTIVDVPAEAGLLFTETSSFQFVMSINREKMTADNFSKMIEQKFPNKKGIIIYHAAHILDNLTAYGYEVADKKTSIKFDFLGWMGFATSQKKNLKNDYGKLLVDTLSSSNPMGTVCWPKTLINVNPTQQQTWHNAGNINIDQFNESSFFARYRYGSITSEGNIADLYLLAQ